MIKRNYPYLLSILLLIVMLVNIIERILFPHLFITGIAIAIVAIIASYIGYKQDIRSKQTIGERASEVE